MKDYVAAVAVALIVAAVVLILTSGCGLQNPFLRAEGESTEEEDDAAIRALLTNGVGNTEVTVFAGRDAIVNVGQGNVRYSPDNSVREVVVEPVGEPDTNVVANVVE